MVRNIMFIIGGDIGSKVTNTVFIYTQNDDIERAKSIREARKMHSVNVDGNHIYIIGSSNS